MSQYLEDFEEQLKDILDGIQTTLDKEIRKLKGREARDVFYIIY